jgi:hypothetical protein
MLKKIQEMEFVAVELNLYLDTPPATRTPSTITTARWKF